MKEVKHDLVNVEQIPLQEWAELTFGPFAPAYPTLRRWAKTGLIVPSPVKIGNTWFVESHAVYRDRLQVGHFSPTGTPVSVR
ncbi:MAG TPA: excisionase [Noviherbaspirillum sp.]|nr:excisionase [Noviherbaspirillum sp.]